MNNQFPISRYLHDAHVKRWHVWMLQIWRAPNGQKFASRQAATNKRHIKDYRDAAKLKRFAGFLRKGEPVS